jgi:hypothetical protein
MQEGLAEESSRSQKKGRRASQKKEEEGVFVVAMHIPNKRLRLDH